MRLLCFGVSSGLMTEVQLVRAVERPGTRVGLAAADCVNVYGCSTFLNGSLYGGRAGVSGAVFPEPVPYRFC